MDRRAARPGRPRWQVAAALLVALPLGALVVADNLRDDPGAVDAGDRASASPTPTPTSDAATGTPTPSPQKVRRGTKLRPAPEPTPEPTPTASAPEPLVVTTAVANLPNRTSAGGFASSMRTLTGPAPDFLMLNEVSGRTDDVLRVTAPGYAVYRDPRPDRSEGGFQAMNNAVLWDPDRWSLVDAGRVKLVEDDGSYYQGRAVVWDRFAMWAVLQRDDGSTVSVVSTHMMTNPEKYPRQPGKPRASRVQRYAAGMDVLLDTVAGLAARGPVLVGGDMNSFPTQGPWTAAAKMTAAGYQYVRDQAVMYLFSPGAAEVLDHRQVRVDSDHPAIITTVDLSGAAG